MADIDPALGSTDIPNEYQGVWYGVSMEMDGDILPLADLGLDMTVTISKDGMAELNMSGEVDIAPVRDGRRRAGGGYDDRHAAGRSADTL